MSVPGDPRAAGYGVPTAQPRNGLGIAALVLGLLALLLSWTVVGGIVLGILALIFGVLGRGRAKRGQATNGGMSVAGIVLGAIGIVIAAGFIALVVSLFNSPSGQDYYRCMQQAGGNPGLIQQCTDQLGRRIAGG